MKKYLLYTLVTFKRKSYIQMFELFLQSILLTSNLANFDLLVICDKETENTIKELRIIEHFPNILYQTISKSKTLYDALLNKCDIYRFKTILHYAKVLYLDCDIIVSKNLDKVFEFPIKEGVLYAPQEGELTSKFWYSDLYKDSNIRTLKKANVKSFNSGTYMFIPSKQFIQHFENVQKLAKNYKGTKHFYDQSFFNYYFNTHRLSSTEHISNVVKIFPETNKYYPRKYIIHFAGIGRYKEKTQLMRDYCRKLQEHSKNTSNS